MCNTARAHKTVMSVTATLILALTCIPHAYTQNQFRTVPPLSFQNELTSLTQNPVPRQQQPPQQQPFNIDPPEILNSGLNGPMSKIDNINRLRHLLEAAKGAQKFGLEFLDLLVESMQDDRDFMVSPFAIWSLLILLLQGASNNTYRQLRDTLHVTLTDEQLRNVYRTYQEQLNSNTSTIEVASLQAIFTSDRLPVELTYKKTIQEFGGILREVDFGNRYTYTIINEYVANATRGLIKTTVLPQDLLSANMYMFSSLFFKGQWRYPFNASMTRSETFYNEQNQPVGKVMMMVQENKFVYTGTVRDLNGYVLELPYGNQNRLSMLIMLPKHNVSLVDMVHNLNKIGLAPILDRLDIASRTADDDVEVLFPKFTTRTDFKLADALKYLGISDVFDPSLADLSRMSSRLYVKDCVHTTKIIVDEEGTQAAAVAAATLINKTSPPKFNLNKPFVYLIVEKTTQLLLFAGKVVKPSFE